ncbi:MAG: hypothetical protein NTY95_12790, partial [Bacteroidia bacterium]|nr:hypothetical protein [Bacteroidia bacterium]
MKRTLLFIFLSGSSCFFLHGQTINHWETAVFNTDIWRYWIGTSEPDQNWRSLSFEDSSWPEGPGGFGYGDNDDNTIIPQCFSVCL